MPMLRDAGGLPATGKNWRAAAACLEQDPELFFPVGTRGPALRQTEQAKAVCRTCRVVDSCLEWALESGEDTGVWGGLDEDERRLMRRPGPPRRPLIVVRPSSASREVAA